MKETLDRRTRTRRPVVQSLFSEAATEGASRANVAFPLRLPQSPEFRDLNAFVALAGQWIADYRSTASVMPSSPQLARAMVLPAQVRRAKTIVEFGPGTGPMTELILEGLPADGKVLSFEINPVFVDYLAKHFPDPRLHVVPAGAETVCEALREQGHETADAVISSLPLSFFGTDLRNQIVGGAAKALGEGGVFTQFQYASGLDCSGRFPKPYDLRPILGKHFRRVRRHLVWRNLPPAFVYICSNH
jgi:phospholipid N-methyltransferase